MIAAIAATPAHADVTVLSPSAPATITDPVNAGFTVNYSLTGTSLSASAQLRFFLSQTRDGSSGVIEFFNKQILLTRTAGGLFSPPAGPQSQFMTNFNYTPNGQTAFQSIAAACAPQRWFILARVDFFSISSTLAMSSFGTTKLPDFSFTAGTISPTSIPAGGTTNISFTVGTPCPVNQQTTVGVFIGDASFNLLSFVGDVTIPANVTSASLPPTGITFAPTTAPGNYSIVLIADDHATIAETNENNNAGAFSLTITAPAAASQHADPDDVDALLEDIGLPSDSPAVRRALPATQVEAR
jgi:hypothetical protein